LLHCCCHLQSDGAQLATIGNTCYPALLQLMVVRIVVLLAQQ